MFVEALERRSEQTEAYLPDVAYHAFEAGMWEQALHYGRAWVSARRRCIRPRPPSRISAMRYTRRSPGAAAGAGPASCPWTGVRSPWPLRPRSGRFRTALGLPRRRAMTARSGRGCLISASSGRAATTSGAVSSSSGPWRRPSVWANSARRAQSLNRLGNWHVNREQPQHGRASPPGTRHLRAAG